MMLLGPGLPFLVSKIRASQGRGLISKVGLGALSFIWQGSSTDLVKVWLGLAR
jgi:hypothetical protein